MAGIMGLARQIDALREARHPKPIKEYRVDPQVERVFNRLFFSFVGLLLLILLFLEVRV